VLPMSSRLWSGSLGKHMPPSGWLTNGLRPGHGRWRSGTTLSQVCHEEGTTWLAVMEPPACLPGGPVLTPNLRVCSGVEVRIVLPGGFSDRDS
jgi:hypothetical protein